MKSVDGFTIGQRVKAIEDESGRKTKGKIGTVVTFLSGVPQTIGVRFDEQIGHLHDLHGHLAEDRGLWMRPCDLVLAESETVKLILQHYDL